MGSRREVGRVQHDLVASDCLIRCTGLGASQRAVQGRVDWGAAAGSVPRAAQGASYEGELAHGAALSAYRSQHKTGGEVTRTEAPVDGVLTYIAAGRGI